MILFEDPTLDPSVPPSLDPTNEPTLDPTMDPTFVPTVPPSLDPTTDPTLDPTLVMKFYFYRKQNGTNTQHIRMTVSFIIKSFFKTDTNFQDT